MKEADYLELQLTLFDECECPRGGRQPRFFVWENVPGAFSSNKGLDFRAVLEEIGQTEIPMPEGGKWAPAGMVQCDRCDIAWRLLDAKFFGVPQRRKRIFLVADFANTKDRCAEVLFERQSVPRTFEQECKKRQDATATITRSTGNSDCDEFAAGFKPEQGVNARSLGYKEEQAPTLTGNTPGVVYGIAGNVMIDRQVQNGGNGVGVQENISYTLNTIDRHAVCIGNGQVAQARIQEKVGALNCMHDQQAVMQSLAVDGKNFVEASVNGPLMSSAEHNIESNNVVRQRYAVRRLTPLECERLQGLPDGYTLIDDKSCSDSARYKALGNGMAQPCADFVIRRIVEEVERETKCELD